MEVKAIIYLIGGVIYLVYTVLKKKGETTMPAMPPKQPVKPTVSKTIDEILNEARQQQKPKPQPAPLRKELFVKEKPAKKFEEGRTNFRTYERTETEEEKTVEASELARRQAAKIPVIQQEEEAPQITFNAREAFIGSVIFEKKW
ncbi:MAG: hypothetical protein U0T73_11145 [Chitinophagales bacterium]